ncbi:MAG: DMT family transporter [Nocardioides sp.]
MPLVAVSVAALSAAGFAVSTSLQHHANGEMDDALGTTGLLGALSRRPWWLLGQVVGLVSFALHAVALHLGLLVVVQPVVVSGIVLAVPVRAALERRLPSLSELGTVAMTAAGLALFLVFVRPDASRPPSSAAALALLVLGSLSAVAAAAWAGRGSGRVQATGYGFASGVLFGLTAGLVKLAGALAPPSHGLVGHVAALASSWPTWTVPVVGLAGVALNQRAYRAAPLSASMPLLNIVDVVVAIAFGVVAFGETPAHSAPALAGQAAALVLIAIGLRRLGRQQVAEDTPAAAPRLTTTRSHS